MIELLALPEWNAPSRTIEDWSDQFARLGHTATLERESDGETWLVVASLSSRGYVESERGAVSAINFELSDPDPAAASTVIATAARMLGWTITIDDEEDDEDDEDD